MFPLTREDLSMFIGLGRGGVNGVGETEDVRNQE